MQSKEAEPNMQSAIPVQNTQNVDITETVRTERARLLSFIQRRIPIAEEAEDIMQDVFYELVESKRLMKPIEKLASWIYTVARNKINDFYRKKKTVLLEDTFVNNGDEETLMLADVLPSLDGSPEDELMKNAVMDVMAEALDELPEAQSRAFIMHELEGKSLNEIAEETGVPLKTVISRKRYAVLHLRERLNLLYKDLLGN